VVRTGRYVPRSFAADIVKLQLIALGETAKMFLTAFNAILTLGSPGVRNDSYLVALLK
jgi:hypothetical protein